MLEIFRHYPAFHY